MSARYEFLPDRNGVVIECYGNLLGHELYGIHQKIDEETNARQVHYYLYDLSEIDSLEISAESLLQLAREDRARIEASPSLKMAFVANHDVVRSVIFMWCGYIDLGDQSVRQFSNRDQAFAWLHQPIVQVIAETS